MFWAPVALSFSITTKENRDRPKHRRARDQTNECEARDALYKSGEAVAVGSGWAARRLFAVNSTAIGSKKNAADRPVRLTTDRRELCRAFLAATIPVSYSAMRQITKLPANAIMAKPV